MASPIRVLFLCTGNSARSQMAEGLLRHLGGARYEVFSAGTAPRPIHPLAITAMAEIGIDIAHARSKPLDVFVGDSFHYIITVCDRAADNCPTFPGDNERIHWGFEDPAAVRGDAPSQLRAFRRVRNEINERLRLWLTLQNRSL